MKIVINVDEAYPIYSIIERASPSAVVVDVDEETVKRWRQALDLYDTIHEEISKTLELQNK